MEITLSKEEKLIIEEYLRNGFVQTRAYLAGFPNSSYKNASANAYKVFRRPHVQAAIDARLEEELGSMKILATKVLRKLELMAFAEKGDPDFNAQVSLKAIDLIQKQLGLQTSNVKAKVENTTVEINILGEEDEN